MHRVTDSKIRKRGDKEPENNERLENSLVVLSVFVLVFLCPNFKFILLRIVIVRILRPI